MFEKKTIHVDTFERVLKITASRLYKDKEIKKSVAG